MYIYSIYYHLIYLFVLIKKMIWLIIISFDYLNSVELKCRTWRNKRKGNLLGSGGIGGELSSKDLGGNGSRRGGSGIEIGFVISRRRVGQLRADAIHLEGGTIALQVSVRSLDMVRFRLLHVPHDGLQHRRLTLEQGARRRIEVDAELVLWRHTLEYAQAISKSIC